MDSLPADQKCILYSLLYYEDNKTRNDGEQWLSRLNDIRGTLFDKGAVSLTQTEDDRRRLKNQNMIEDDDQHIKITSTEITKAALYLLWWSVKSKFCDNHSYMLTLLSPAILREYCESQDQYPGYKKVFVCGSDLCPSLVYRLQMDILIHPAIEDRDVQKAAAWICK
jgi:hypothetical protein